MAHIHELVDFTVEVFVVYKNKVFLRRHDKYDLWLSVGGHVELDEEPNQAAVREVWEEVGLHVILDSAHQRFKFDTNRYQELIPPRFLNVHQVNATHRHVCLTYFATSAIDTVRLSSTEQTSAWGWYSKVELEGLDLQPQVRHYAEQALECLKSI